MHTNTPEEIFNQLQAAALPLMEHYQEDLTKHDRRSITESFPGIPFIHGTRKTGTYIETMLPADDPRWPRAGERIPYLFGTADREQILRGQTACVDNEDRGASHTWHHYDGRSLRKITHAEALKIWKAYERRTLATWQQQQERHAAA